MAQSSTHSVIIAAGVALVALLPAETAFAFSAADPARILYVGDSIAAETRDTVKWWTQVSGKATTNDSAFPGMAICDFLEGKPAGMPNEKKLKSQVRSLKPQLVILQFWGNGFTDCIKQNPVGSEQYYNQYFWDALNAVEQIKAAATEVNIPKPKILWVLQGPDRSSADRTRRLNDNYAFAASNYGDRTADAGFEVSMAAYPYSGPAHDRYAWTQFLPCTDFERQTGYCTQPASYGGVTQLHKTDDSVHFCLGNSTNWGFSCDAISPGIVRYGMRIAHDANVWLGI
jgi:hypothetical protein